MPSEYIRIASIVRFWERVDRTTTPNGCWPWIGSRNEFGYGRLRRAGKWMAAHIFSFTIATQSTPIPGFIICHTCDYPPCVRPEHLYLGTPIENSHDYWMRGRWRHWPIDDPRHTARQKSRAVQSLTPAQIDTIRALRFSGVPAATLAAENNVSIKAIWRLTWRPAGDYLYEASS